MLYLNGQWLAPEEAQVSVMDRGFLFGDGVYEVIPVYSRHPFRLDEHLDRLDRVLAGVRSAEWQIRQDARMHKLSPSAARKLEGEANGIRHRAVTVASAHRGEIPNATFQLLKGDLRKLDRNLVRMS